MNPISRFLSATFRRTRPINHLRPLWRESPVRLGLEHLDDRHLPSSSPLTWATNHDLLYGSGAVLKNVENYEWSSTTNVGFALQQGGIVDSFVSSSPSKVHATIGDNVESIGLASDGTIYELIAGGQLQVSTNSGWQWTILDKRTESFGIAGNGGLYTLDEGGTLQFSPNRGSTWNLLDSDTQSFAVSPIDTVYNLAGGGVLERSIDSGADWTTIDDQTVSFGFSNNGNMLYDLDGGGKLQASNNQGDSWTTVDTSTQSFAVSSSNILYDLHAGGSLKDSPNSGSSWTTIDPSAQTIGRAQNNALYVLDVGGALRMLSFAGSSWQVLDAAVRSFNISENGTVYDLDASGLLQSLSQPGAAWFALDNVAEQIGVDTGGTLYDLDAGGSLWAMPQGGSWEWLENFTQSFAVEGNGVVYNLQVNDLLQVATGPSGSWTSLDYTTLGFAVSPNGTLYDLDPNGQLWAMPLGGSWQWLDGSTRSFTLMPNGGLVDLDEFGSLWVLPYDGSWQWLDGATQSYAVGPNGAIYSLLSGGILESSTNHGDSWKTIDSTTEAFDVLSNGTIENLFVNAAASAKAAPYVSLDAGNSWYNLFAIDAPDGGVQALAGSDYARDGELTRADILGLFAEVESDGTVTASELTSLENLVNSSAVAIPDAVRNLAEKVVDGNPADGYYQGQWIGVIAPGSSAGQMADLTQKWFYGTDLPYADGYAYAVANGSLFGRAGVPRFNDVAQGYDADCYFLAALGQVALQAPAEIESMFTNNGDGTYTVRFYNNGVPDYVTVNSYLPEDANDNYVFANYNLNGQPNGVGTTNVLWVALAEKAYSQLAEEGWSRADHGQYANSYDSIDYGWPTMVMSQITGSTVYFSVVLEANSSAESIVLSDIAQNHLISMLTQATLPDGNSEFLGNHAYTLQGYDPNTGLFTFLNPYDDGGSVRIVEMTWQQLEPYVFDFEDVTAPAGMGVASVMGNPPP